MQKCEDIVHVDPLTTSVSDSIRVKAASQSNKRKRSNQKTTQQISEFLASTRPYPSWWSEIESLSVLRKQSIGDTVLERNICFVDTPGLGQGASGMESMEKTLSYIGEQAKKSFSVTPGDGEIIGLLGGSGGTQVDIVLYLISKGTHARTFPVTLR